MTDSILTIFFLWPVYDFGISFVHFFCRMLLRHAVVLFMMVYPLQWVVMFSSCGTEDKVLPNILGRWRLFISFTTLDKVGMGGKMNQETEIFFD